MSKRKLSEITNTWCHNKQPKLEDPDPSIKLLLRHSYQQYQHKMLSTAFQERGYVESYYQPAKTFFKECYIKALSK